VRRRLRALTGERAFPVLVLATVFALWLNVASGALVRVTNSGLGCPDWPLCNGRTTPPFASHAVIEYGNRIMAAGVILVTVLLAISAWRVRRGRDGHEWRLSLAIGAGTFAQGPLGGITVLSGLHPIAVMSHFLLALVVLGIAVVLLIDVYGWAVDWRPRPSWALPAAVALPVATFALLVSGAVVTMSGTHPGGEDVKRLWNLLDAAYVHVRIAGVFVALLAAFLYALARIPAPPRATARLAWALVLLVALQISIGEYQWRHQLPWWAVLAHVSVAGLLWVVAVALGRSLWPRRRTQAVDDGAGERREQRERREPSSLPAS
jgi:cytochrome c oxidase assembly protein subunit 15